MCAAMYMQHPHEDSSTIQCRRSCVGNTFLFSECRLSFRSRSRSRAMQAREPTPRVSACVCGSSDEGRCDPCAHVGRYLVSFAVAHPHLHRRCSGGKGHHPRSSSKKVGHGFLLNARSTPELLPFCPSAPPYYLMYYPPTFERNFLVCHCCSLRWRLMET